MQDRNNRTARSRRGSRWAGALLGALACVGLALAALPARAAGEQLTGTFAGTATGRTVEFRHAGKARSEWAGTLKLQLDGGPEVLVYCVQLGVRVREGNRYRSDGPVLALPNGCQIRYLLDAYPAAEADTPGEAAARQMAIWAFSDGLDPATIGDAAIRDRTIALVTEAESKPCPERRTTPGTLAISPPVSSAPAGQVVTYTLQAGPLDAGRPVRLALDGPAFFADPTGASTGQQQLQIKLGDQGQASVRVISAVAGQARLSAALPYRLEAGTVFSQLDDNSPTQRLVLGERQDLVASATAEARWSSQAPPSTPSVTETPTQADTPTATRERREPTATPTAPPSETPTAPPSETPTAPPSETPTAPPNETPTAQSAETALPTEAATPAAPAPDQAAGGTVPSTLPRTSAPTSRLAWPLMALGALLVCAGALLRPRR